VARSALVLKNPSAARLWRGPARSSLRRRATACADAINLNGIGRFGDLKLEDLDCGRSPVPFVSNRPACAQSITAKRHVIDTAIATRKPLSSIRRFLRSGSPRTASGRDQESGNGRSGPGEHNQVPAHGCPTRFPATAPLNVDDNSIDQPEYLWRAHGKARPAWCQKRISVRVSRSDRVHTKFRRIGAHIHEGKRT
jgi:hypothetical protein